MGMMKQLKRIKMNLPAAGMVLIPLVLCTLLCFYCGCITPLSNSGQPPIHTISAQALITTKNYGLLLWDNKALFNNCWGFEFLLQKELASSVIFYDPVSSTCGWRWSCPQENLIELKGYPCLIVGDKVHVPAGFDASTDPRFPLYLPHMKSLWALGDIRVKGSGDFDFAYDLLFLEGALSTPTAIRTEIMLWLKASKKCPARKVNEYSIAGYAYDFFVNTDWNPGVPYLAFVLINESVPRRIPLHEFIRIGIKEGYVDSNAYLAAVELGAEIWWGEGEVFLSNYRISLNRD